MPAVLSKEASDEERASNVKVLFAAAFMQVCSAVVLMQSTPMIVAQHHAGAGKMRQAKTLQTLNKMASAAALLEFLLNPLFGRLSDRFGRGIFLLLAPIATLLLRGGVVAKPTIGRVALARLALGALIPAFITSLTASVADMYRKDGAGKMAGTNGMLYMTMGLSVVVGSVLGGKLAARDVRLPYALSALLGGGTLVLLLKGYRETLAKEDRNLSPVQVEEVNPFNFVRLFTKSPALAKLNLIVGLQALPANMGDVAQMFAKAKRGWGPQEVGRFQASLGMAAIVSGGLTGRLIKQFGKREYSTLSNLAAIATYYLFGIANTNAKAYAGCLLSAFAQMRSAALSAMILRTGAAEGMGLGQLAADRANLTAVVKVVAPLLSSSLYAAGVKRGNEGLPYFFMVGLLVISQGLMFSIPQTQWV
mmetsp:Transcript_16077/g.62717  ORF Transcript_16077/g.62717 Transcript_16077/m.62717 type:complete len:420 (+) Transcript_16077:50-1309(+)